MTLPEATQAGHVQLLDYSDDYRATKQRVDVPLKSADVAAIVGRARSLADEAHLLFPEVDVLLERAVVALLTDHLVLAGPPGTGKTTLARILAAAFECSSEIATATADWSAYDVIGGLQPRLMGTGQFATEVLRPWLGLVPQAALDCANAVAKHAHDPAVNPMQAHWLIIDEFNRAEIDKAFGPLFTALGGGEARLPLWYGDVPEKREVWIPGRFRLIGTLNSVDTGFVFTFSQGLTRRFTFVYVGVPGREQLAEELTQASTQAAIWYERTYSGTHPTDIQLQEATHAFLNDARVTEAISTLRTVVEYVRYGDETEDRPGWPVGTAQIVDAIRDLALRWKAGVPETDLIQAVDLAIADRIVPLMTNLLRDQLDAFSNRLAAADLNKLVRTSRAIDQVRRAQYTTFA